MIYLTIRLDYSHLSLERGGHIYFMTCSTLMYDRAGVYWEDQVLYHFFVCRFESLTALIYDTLFFETVFWVTPAYSGGCESKPSYL